MFGGVSQECVLYSLGCADVLSSIVGFLFLCRASDMIAGVMGKSDCRVHQASRLLGCALVFRCVLLFPFSCGVGWCLFALVSRYLHPTLCVTVG